MKFLLSIISKHHVFFCLVLVFFQPLQNMKGHSDWFCEVVNYDGKNVR